MWRLLPILVPKGARTCRLRSCLTTGFWVFPNSHSGSLLVKSFLPLHHNVHKRVDWYETITWPSIFFMQRETKNQNLKTIESCSLKTDFFCWRSIPTFGFVKLVEKVPYSSNNLWFKCVGNQRFGIIFQIAWVLFGISLRKAIVDVTEWYLCLFMRFCLTITTVVFIFDIFKTLYPTNKRYL